MAKAAEAIKAAIADEAELDARKLPTDFPILQQQRFHGKPLAYLDPAVTAQKPRQLLDAHCEFYETSYTNIHRGVYPLPERATERFKGSREKMRALINAASTREDRRHVAGRAGNHGCQPRMTPLRVAATNRAGFDLYTVPEEIDRLVQGRHTVNTTPGMGRAREDPSDGGRRG